MTNLFSIFDPVTHFQFLSLNWIASRRVIFLPSLFWVTYRKNTYIIKSGLVSLTKELQSVLNKGIAHSFYLILLTLLAFIFTNNFLGLLPYVFTSTRHLSVTLSLRLALWRGYIFWNFINNFRRAVAHLVPKGTPVALVPFIVLIEIIRNLIRPLTLAVRLAANIVAGHLLLVLVRGPMPNLSLIMILTAFLGLLVLIVLELAVSFIQAYVFITLSSLYIDEVNNINNYEHKIYLWHHGELNIFSSLHSRIWIKPFQKEKY